MYEEWTITIPQLTGEEERKAYVYVPEEALTDPDARYPVLYMFDGQNLFYDEDASYGKCWGIREYFTEHDVPMIVAAIECNHHDERDECGGRLSEYSPFDFENKHFGKITGRGKITMDHLVNEFKPYIDANYPTLPEREYTFISGSSMGGLMTVYALMEYNDVFSRGAALSPAFGFSPALIKDMIKSAKIGRTVLYMDAGSQEMRSDWSRRIYGEVTKQLIRKGVLMDSRVVPDGFHSEASWEMSIPFFLNTLFYGLE